MPIKLSFGQLYLPQTSSFAKNLPRAVENFTNKESSPSDRYAKKLTFGNTSLLFLEAILRGRPLQEMADHLESSPWMQRWLGLSSIRASSLHRKLERLPTESLQELCHQAAKKLATMYCDASLRSLGRLAAVDSSMVTLGSKRAEWAYVSKDFHANKLHLSLGLVNETTSYPLRTVLSTAVDSDNDDEVLAALVEPSDVTCVFDRG
ncbi:hypothetical protein GXP70_21010 [Paenibacillus lycopersici]|uniref:Transposase n=1 Tax=Paenibacillus lycopersici TaxID=2704462 RepID=A0A6C0FYN1_9BACL|nr:hypothetical protein [Paenibacillus lycopersici]QHT62216.1 hypothetical protein GXP70_21010 [Paenibacillus lycopersici]